MSSPSQALSPRHRLTVKPRLEALEDRTALSTLTVLNGQDSGPGSLRATIADADPGDTIVFARSVHSIRLTTGELTLDKDLDIRGPGAHRLTISGNDASRVFNVASGEVSLSGLTITRGLADEGSPTFASVGGGILNQGDLTLRGVVVAHNRAVGDADVTLSIGGYSLVGAGLGGGVANLGTLSVDGAVFAYNTAVGADGSAGADFPNLQFPGMALGGGLYNLLADAAVTDTLFVGNVARAGDDSTGSFAGLGGGGAIYNDASLTVSHSAFARNSALGGDGNVSDVHSGHGVGGAIVSGSVTAAFGLRSASLEVSHSAFTFNRAVGGDDNEVTLPLDFVSGIDGPSDGFGGGIFVYQGEAAITRSLFSHNHALGGTGGGDQKGSRGAGGGVFFLNFIGGVTATVSHSAFLHNDAIGGRGTDGVRGGDAWGGAIVAGGFGAPFSGPGTITIANSLVSHNLARGGDGGQGADGGDGLGGGLYNDSDSTLDLEASRVTFNRARGGRGKGGGSDGAGIGGGVYDLGTLTIDALTVIARNKASTSNDDVFG